MEETIQTTVVIKLMNIETKMYYFLFILSICKHLQKNYLNMPNSATNFEENAFAVGNKSYLNNNNPYATNTFKAADYSTSKSPLRGLKDIKYFFNYHKKGTERSSIKEYLDSKYNFKNVL